MRPVVPPADESSSAALVRARRQLIARRLGLFALCWLATTALWSVVLLLEGVLPAPRPALVLVAVQLATLVAAIALCRTAPSSPRVPVVAVGASILLGHSSTVLFAAYGGDGDKATTTALWY